MAARPFVFKLSWLETGTDTPVYGFNAPGYSPWDTPMKLLYLLRHAKSSWDDPDLDDFDRPLNKRGRKAAKTPWPPISRKPAFAPDRWCCARPAKRTRETLETYDGGDSRRYRPCEYDRRIYEASYQTLLHCAWAIVPAEASLRCW